MKNSEENKRRSGADLLALLLHSLIGVVVSLLLSLIAVFFVSSERLPHDSIPLLSSLFVLIGAGVSGFLSGRKFGKTIMISLVQAMLYIVVTYLTGALLFGRLLPTNSPLQVIAFCVIGALTGGILSAVKVKKKPR